MTKCTPGPWEIVEFENPNKSTIAQVGNLLIVVTDDNDGDFGDEEADAALVAASPDLFAACEAIDVGRADALSLARAALMKARGQQ